MMIWKAESLSVGQGTSCGKRSLEASLDEWLSFSEAEGCASGRVPCSERGDVVDMAGRLSHLSTSRGVSLWIPSISRGGSAVSKCSFEPLLNG